jgi:hypothetical protein
LPTNREEGGYGGADDGEFTLAIGIVSLFGRDLRCGHIPKEEEGHMFATKRVRIVGAVLAVALASGGTAATVATSASASAKPAHVVSHTPADGGHHKLSLKRFNLNGWVINAKYTLGRNTGNTFQQTYKTTMVQGVPIKGPFVGVTFPPEDYVALPIGDHQLYITWLDPSTFAIVDVFVMNFRTHTVYDYAPGSDKPESAGTITVVKRGHDRFIP